MTIRDDIAAIRADTNKTERQQTIDIYNLKIAALRDVINRANPQVNPHDISQYAIMKMNQNLALDGFKKEFSDVVANPLVLKLSIMLENERLAEMSINASPISVPGRRAVKPNT